MGFAMIRRIFPVAFLAAAFGPVTPAAADEAYICDAGRIVYVKPGQLESLKRTDACIAGYYGLTVETPVKADTIVKAPAKSPAAASVPKVPPGGAVKGLTLEREARAAAAKEMPQPAVAVVKSPKPIEKPAPTPVAATSDYRNVVILNATPGPGGIFRHDK